RRQNMRNHSILALAVIILCAGPAADARYSGGTGDPNDPYRIATAQDLNDIGNYEEDWDKHFVLINDVNLAEYTGTQFKIIGRWINWYDPNNYPFTGIFDGNDHKILSFTWTSTGRNGIGLFGCVGAGGWIKNLGLENVDVNAIEGFTAGGLVGQNQGTITNCYAIGNVSSEFGFVGGLVGYNYRGTISSCYASAAVSGNCDVGGLVGLMKEGTIENSYATGSVSETISETAYGYVGGLVGVNYENTINYESTITNCYATGDVSGSGDVGGLVGGNFWGTISSCYYSGNVSGSREYIGGLVGFNSWDTKITNCYSTGNVSGYRYVSGGVGYNIGAITNCYSTGSVTATYDFGGFVAYSYGNSITASFWDTQTSDCNASVGGTGKTTAEMKTMSTFTEAGWDFVEIWGIGENQTYPFLRTEPAGDSNHDKKVDLLDLAILASRWLEGAGP
ncbi:MAG: hypothetical protein NTX52_09710, partial [Planctomycetota bacterium]|nr:hypothetical protein [Planctomycetota bacterium]